MRVLVPVLAAALLAPFGLEATPDPKPASKPTKQAKAKLIHAVTFKVSGMA